LGGPSPTCDPHRHGEILCTGRRFRRDISRTRRRLDDAGWFYTGDLGAIDTDSSLRVAGRKRCLNCSDGSNIYPGFIELQLENEPFINQAVLLGDGRPFIAALIVPACQRIAEALKRDIENLSDEIIDAALWSQIARVNKRLEVYEQIRKIAVLRHDFPPEVRSINHFHKVKVDRKMVAERFGQEIDAIYHAAPEGGGH
jgi:long-chain acyl-CoA synthetase